MGELESVVRPPGVRDRGVPSNLDLTRVAVEAIYSDGFQPPPAAISTFP